MKTEKIGLLGSERWKAMKAWHPFAAYVISTERRRIYLTSRQYSEIMPTLEVIGSRLTELNTLYEECGAERERAIDGWYGEQIRRQELERHNSILIYDNFTLMAKQESLRKPRERQLKNETTPSETDSDSSLNITSQKPRYAAEFIRACTPKSRTSPPKIYSNGHHTDHHDRPRKFDKFLGKIGSSEFVRGVHVHTNPPAQTKGKQITVHADEGKFYLSIPYFDGNSFGATVRADITAETNMQAEYTLHNMRHLLQL